MFIFHLSNLCTICLFLISYINPTSWSWFFIDTNILLPDNIEQVPGVSATQGTLTTRITLTADIGGILGNTDKILITKSKFI